jgi:cell division septal protein FtsQ
VLKSGGWRSHPPLFICYDTAMRPLQKRIDPNTVVLLKHLGVGVLLLCLVALGVTALWYGTRIAALTITTVEAEGGKTIDPIEVITLANETLSGEYLGLIPKRFAWFYPEKAMYERISTIERIHSIEIERVDSTTLRIIYDEYVPHALWCQTLEEQNCLFIDDQGYAFAQAPMLSGGSFLRVVTSGRAPAVGETAIDAALYQSIQELVSLLAAQGWFVSHAEIDQVADIFLKVVGGGELKVNFQESPASTVDTLLVLLTANEFKHLEPGNFQYIDLRFGNKVFVNEQKNEVESDVVVEMSTTTESESVDGE